MFCDLACNPLKEGDVVKYDLRMDERKQKEQATNVTGGSGWPVTKGKFGGKGKGMDKGYGKGFGEWQNNLACLY